jgi:hypothetical protein
LNKNFYKEVFMVILKEKSPLFEFNEMATSCHPKGSGGKYPMWIRVEYTNGEHKPPHAHLYRPDGKPSPKSLITKFLITDVSPRKISDVLAMKGKPPIPPEFANLIIAWSKDKTRRGVNNWDALWDDWEHLALTF